MLLHNAIFGGDALITQKKTIARKFPNVKHNMNEERLNTIKNLLEK